MKKIFYIILFFITAQLWAAGEIQVKSTVDRSSILIGDVFTYSVIVSHDDDVHLQPEGLAKNLGQFEIRDYAVLEPEKQDGKIVEQTNYLLSTFMDGEFTIPELEIKFTIGQDSTIHALKTEPITVTVNSMNPDEEGDIRDIKPPITPPRDWKSLLWMSFLITLAIAAIVFVIYYFKRRKEGKEILPVRVEPPRPPHEVALEALDNLVAGDLLETGQIKQYFIELSDIFRHYVEGRYLVVALEMTTTELLYNMKKGHLDDETINDSKTLLNKYDLVKFAKYKPSADEIDESTQMTRNFVLKTKIESMTTDEDKPEVVDEIADDETSIKTKEEGSDV